MAEDDGSDNALSSGDSTAAASIYASLFALLLLVHAALFVARCWRCHRAAWFCLPFIVGGMMETTGFITRAIGTRTTPTTALKVAQVLNILLAPVIFAAAIYMTLGRIMAFAKPSPPGNAATEKARALSRWNPRRWRITPVFVLGDVACFVVQAIGAGTVAAGGGAKVGGDIVLGGLALQIAVFGIFVGVAVRVHVGLKRREREQERQRQEGLEEVQEGPGRGGLKAMCAACVTACVKAKGWEGQMVGLYVMSGAVMGRNVYRVVEYILGADGYLMQHEWPLYVFDASMMVVVMSVGLRCYALQTTTATNKKKADANADKLLLRESSVEGYGHDMTRYLTRRRSSGLS